jgi:hypothetical protein
LTIKSLTVTPDPIVIGSTVTINATGVMCSYLAYWNICLRKRFCCVTTPCFLLHFPLASGSNSHDYGICIPRLGESLETTDRVEISSSVFMPTPRVVFLFSCKFTCIVKYLPYLTVSYVWCSRPRFWWKDCTYRSVVLQRRLGSPPSLLL